MFFITDRYIQTEVEKEKKIKFFLFLSDFNQRYISFVDLWEFEKEIPWNTVQCLTTNLSYMGHFINQSPGWTIKTFHITTMSLVIFCLLFSSVDYVPVKGEIIWYLSLTAWLISLSIMLSSSIHAVAKGISSFFLGRGVYQSYYKGHMDKIKGEGRKRGERWGGVEGWRENADNCNWITIKTFLKKKYKSLIKTNTILKN